LFARYTPNQGGWEGSGKNIPIGEIAKRFFTEDNIDIQAV